MIVVQPVGRLESVKWPTLRPEMSVSPPDSSEAKENPPGIKGREEAIPVNSLRLIIMVLDQVF
jgi:hypothetical protein